MVAVQLLVHQDSDWYIYIRCQHYELWLSVLHHHVVSLGNLYNSPILCLKCYVVLLLLFTSDLFIFLEGRMTKRMRDEKKIFSSTCGLAEWPDMDQAEARNQELHLCLPCGWQVPRHLGYHLLL